MKNLIISMIILLGAVSCMPPQEKKENPIAEKHNYIILLDLSDRLIVQDNQPKRDKEIIAEIYKLFEQRVKNNMYIRSRDEIKIVIAQQRGSGLSYETYEDKMYVNISKVPVVLRRKNEEMRRNTFLGALDTLYQEAVFSKDPGKYYGADIWKYFYEDLQTDYSNDTLTSNILFIVTDGYPVVGKDIAKLEPVKNKYSNLKVILVEAAPRDKDMEWGRVQELWQSWFKQMEIDDYHFIKRMAITKEIDLIEDLTNK